MIRNLISLFIIAMAFVSCNSGKEQTIENLKVAIQGEATASAKYDAFANQAAKDSLYNVEALFRAVSIAEAQHVGHLQALLVKLDEAEVKLDLDTFTVENTVQNLQDAISGETAEFSGMYPTFAAEANKENQKDIALVFNRIIDAEIKHAKVLGETLGKLANDSNISATYFVCPACGNLYAEVADNVCKLCATPKAHFIVGHAVMPLTASMPVAPLN